MSDFDVKREEIAALIAGELGLGPLGTLSPSDRAVVDRQTAETIEGCDDAADAPADFSEATHRLRDLLQEYRRLEELRTDEVNVRLAEEGEVFSREDDA